MIYSEGGLWLLKMLHNVPYLFPQRKPGKAGFFFFFFCSCLDVEAEWWGAESLPQRFWAADLGQQTHSSRQIQMGLNTHMPAGEQTLNYFWPNLLLVFPTCNIPTV